MEKTMMLPAMYNVLSMDAPFQINFHQISCLFLRLTHTNTGIKKRKVTYLITFLDFF